MNPDVTLSYKHAAALAQLISDYIKVAWLIPTERADVELLADKLDAAEIERGRAGMFPSATIIGPDGQESQL